VDAARSRTDEYTWSHLIQSKTFARYDSSSRTGSLASLALELLHEQKESWPQLAAGYESLTSVRTRELRCDGFPVWLQFNPGRIVSTGAKVDEQSIRERRCFLCVEHLPSQQKGILYNDEFLVLCNPAPIFTDHFTVSHVRHLPQSFEEHAGTMLEIARAFRSRFTLFYNGPKCGASAPDHMHFQACPRGIIPVERAAQEEARRQHRRNVRGVDIFTLARFGRQVIVFESAQSAVLEQVLLSLVSALRSITGTTKEPMLNILCGFNEGDWRVIVFPRSKHRPDVYFKEDDERVLISPAAVDIGGLIVTPLEKDFNNVNASLVESIFKEVSVAPTVVERAIESLS
jgi:hypothetical protein